jgi:hypothetical protein
MKIDAQKIETKKMDENSRTIRALCAMVCVMAFPHAQVLVEDFTRPNSNWTHVATQGGASGVNYVQGPFGRGHFAVNPGAPVSVAYQGFAAGTAPFELQSEVEVDGGQAEPWRVNGLWIGLTSQRPDQLVQDVYGNRSAWQLEPRGCRRSFQQRSVAFE